MPTELRRKDVKTLVQQGRAQLIDVMPARDYKREHLPKAINIPLNELGAETTRELKKEQAVILYGADYSCDLSARAAFRLETLGFQEVYRYTAGKADWLAAGFDTEGTDAGKRRLKQLLKQNVMTCTLKERLGTIRNRRSDPADICVVINDRNIVLGVIAGDAWEQDSLKTAAEIMESGPHTFRPHSDPSEVLKDMRRLNLENVIVTTSDGELLGAIPKRERKTQKAKKAA
jgi:rhodanese-related sulfurtransferase